MTESPDLSNMSIASPPTTPNKRKAGDMSYAPTLTINTLVLPPLPPNLPLVPVPPILDQSLEDQVFTHSSYYGKPKDANSLDMSRGIQDNEKLEHVGDALLGSIVTLLLHQLYPNLQVGPATKLKSFLVSNSTLAQLSFRYGFHTRIRAAPSTRYSIQNNESTRANTFEAYIAGLYLSYLQARQNRIPTPPPTPKQEPGLDVDGHVAKVEEEEEGDDDDPASAYAKLSAWLRRLYKPIAIWAMEEMLKAEIELRGDQGEDGELDSLAGGALALLNEHFIHKEAGIPDCAPVRAGSDKWTVFITATKKDGASVYGEATRSSQKQAKAVAAYKICKEMGLIR